MDGAMGKARNGLIAWRRRLAALAALMLGAGLFGAPLATPADAEALTLQGSTTFNSTIMQPLGKEVEAETGIGLVVVPNKSDLGLLALFAGEGDMAMISTSLAKEIEILRGRSLDLPYDRLKSHEITRVRMAFVVNEANRVEHLPLAAIARILKGEVANWKEVDGGDLPIRVAAVRPGGGVLSTVESRLLGKGQISAPDAVRVQVGSQVVKIVDQEPGALGITQLSLVQNQPNVRELATDEPIEQVLSLVTLDAPGQAAAKVIAALQRRFATPVTVR